MKRFMFILLILSFLTFPSCQPRNDNTASEKDAPSNLETNSSERPEYKHTSDEDIRKKFFYESFGVYSGNAVRFGTYIEHNPLDEDNDAEISSVNSVTQSAMIEVKYEKLWREEMEYSIEKYKEVLTEEDRREFDELQEYWEKAVIGELSFEMGLVRDPENYNMDFGRQFSYYISHQFKLAYQERTLHIKYMHYLIEREGDRSLPPEDLNSIKFKYARDSTIISNEMTD